MKRFTALAAALILCLICLTSCANDDSVPDGMKLASCADEPFKLYVPDEMTVNTDSGISSAFGYIPQKFIISARYYTPADSGMTLEQYLHYCAEGYADSLDSFELKAIDPAVLSGVDALKMSYTAKIDGVDYSCSQVSVAHKGDMISLNFYLPVTSIEGYAEVISNVTSAFVLCDKPEPVNDELVDKKTPDGMKIASGDKVEYRLYVPKSWICNSESGKSEAYYPESERSNVTVTSFSPEGTMSAADYVAECEKKYAESINGYTLIEKADTKVANKDAVALTFGANYDGISFKIKQVTFVFDGMVYSITYTSTAERFDSHLADVDRIISEFSFRTLF